MGAVALVYYGEPPNGYSITVGHFRREAQKALVCCVAAWMLLAGKEDHLAWLQAGILIEECGQGAGDGGGVGAVLAEGLGGDEDEPGVGLARGPVLGFLPC